MRRTKGLYKRRNVYWMCYKVDGKLYRESTGVTTQKEAEYKLSCRRKEIEDGQLPNTKRVNYKFADLAKEYDNTWAKQKRSYRTAKSILKQLVEEFGNHNVNELNTRIVERYKVKHSKTHKLATTNRQISFLQHMISKGVEWDMASEEILRQVRKVKLYKLNNKRLRFLTVEECQTLIECCRPHLRPIVITALHTGMRRGEILNLKWNQLDLKHGFILLDKTKNDERREIPLDDTLRKMFEEMPHSIESIYVFTDRDGNPYKDVKRSFKTTLKEAGIRDFKFHDLRHTFASHLVMSGIDITSVKELLGHKSLTMTLRYAHLAPGHKRYAVNKLDNVLKNSEKNIFSSQFGSHPDP